MFPFPEKIYRLLRITALFWSSTHDCLITSSQAPSKPTEEKVLLMYSNWPGRTYLLFSIYLLEKIGGQIGVRKSDKSKLSTDITFNNYFSVPCTTNKHTRPFLYAQFVPMEHHISRAGGLNFSEPTCSGR